MNDPTYFAPALEKGLEILELLCRQPQPLSVAEIASAVGRSKAEIYRCLITLEAEDFIRRETDSLKYVATDLLFDLGIHHAPRKQLVDIALPHMRRLAQDSHQSCHLSVISQDTITVVANAESEAGASFSVRVGYSISFVLGTSGRIIHAFQSPPRQAEWLAQMHRDFDPRTIRQFCEDAAEAQAQGFLIKNSAATRGIVDLGVPIFKKGQPNTAIAALIVPFLSHLQNPVPREQVLDNLIDTARHISDALY